MAEKAVAINTIRCCSLTQTPGYKENAKEEEPTKKANMNSECVVSLLGYTISRTCYPYPCSLCIMNASKKNVLLLLKLARD